MKNIYFSSTLMWNAELSELFQTAYRMKADGIELWAQQFEYRNYNEKECLNLQKQYPLQIFIHSNSWDMNFASINRGIREASLNEIKRSIDLAARLHAPEITVHPPRETLCGNKSFYQEIAHQGLQEIFQYGRSAGVTVSLEIMEKIPKELMTTREAVSLLTRNLYREFSYTVDTAHCTDEKELEDFLQNLPNISKIHISNRKGSQYHTVLADGDFSFQTLWPILERRNLPMVVEGFDSTDQYTALQENMSYLEKLKEYYR